jgi:hypothetical protein
VKIPPTLIGVVTGKGALHQGGEGIRRGREREGFRGSDAEAAKAEAAKQLDLFNE